MTTTDLSNSGAVKGAAIDTSPATNKASLFSLTGIVAGIAAAAYGITTKDPSSIHWASIIAGGLGVSSGTIGGVMTHVRALEAEAEHAIETVAGTVKAVDPAFEASVQAEVAKRLQAAATTVSTYSVQ